MALTYSKYWTENSGSQGGDITSPSFSVSIGDVILVLFAVEDNTAVGTLSISNTGTAFTWANRALTDTSNECKVAAWFAVASAAQSMTVTVLGSATVDSSEASSMAVLVHSGAHATDPVPSTKVYSGVGATDVSQSITPSSSGSCMWMIAGDWNQTNSFAARTNNTLDETHDVGGSYTSALIRPTTQPRTDANAFTIGETDTSGKIAWIALEVRAAESSSVTVTPGAGGLTITGYAPTVTVSSTSVTASPGVASLSIAGFAPAIFRTQSASPGVAALTFTGFAPTVKVTQSASPGVGALSITGLAPTIVVTNNLIAQPGAAGLSITGSAPTILRTQSAAPGVGALTITGYAPTANITQSVAPGVGALSITGFAPTVRVSLSAQPGAAALSITGAAPTANVTQSAAPGVASIVLTGHQPSAVVSAAGTVHPGVASLDITGHAPTANVSQSVAPGYAALLLTGFAPTISIASADHIVAPGLAELFIQGHAPDALVSGKRQEAGGKKRRRSRYIKLPEDLEREQQERQEQEREEQAQQAKPQPKRAKRTSKASRGIQLAPEPDLDAQRAAEILAQRTAELMAQQQAAQEAMRAEGMAMLQAAAQIEAENEMLMLLLMAA